uniref:Uncharacterized protein n=1 Tax=Lepeophtheirus salmonis TaxID=72036 RepID=A0A0K2UZF2_LEPSM
MIHLCSFSVQNKLNCTRCMILRLSQPHLMLSFLCPLFTIEILFTYNIFGSPFHSHFFSLLHFIEENLS